MRWYSILCAVLVACVACTLVYAKVDNIIHEVRFAEVYRSVIFCISCHSCC